MQRSKNIQVQGTNDSSIISKLSSANKGYFEDNFLNFFANKAQRRSPLINRGYYIRSKAIDSSFKAWFDALHRASCEKCQVISFGAGFDTSYFRLKSGNKLSAKCKYIEVDFSEVMQRKLACINAHHELKSILSGNISDVVTRNHKNIIFQSPQYFLLGVDLNDILELETLLNNIGVDYSVPTLLLSECAITYMDVDRSNNLIKWTQERFPNSLFITYEQVYPNDGFGLVMQNHFMTLGSPLKSVQLYTSIELQRVRFLKMGWKSCHVNGMNSLFSSLPIAEKSRIQNLELFDEYEMWHQKCSHYVLILAWQGLCALSHYWDEGASHEIRYKSLKSWKKIKASPLLQRYGHQSSLLSNGCFLISGGFGSFHQKHQRLKGLAVGDIHTGNAFDVHVHDPENKLGQRMHHSMTRLNDNKIVIFGGRSAPNKLYSGILLLHQRQVSFDETTTSVPGITSNSNKLVEQTKCVQLKSEISKYTYTCSSVPENGCVPCPKWRHSASIIHLNGIECIVFFGGCSEDKKTTNDCYILNTETWTWSEVSTQTETPSARHSHSSVTYETNQVIISGGLLEDERPLSSVHVFDAQTSIWTSLNIKGLLNRYSHTSHVWKNYVVFLGGVNDNPNSPPFLTTINMKTLEAVEFLMPGQEPEYPILLHNHTSLLNEEQIMIVGGGGNCFSFGTHFNKYLLLIDMKELVSEENF